MRPQPVFHRFDNDTLFGRIFLWQIEFGCKIRVIARQCRRVFGAHPPDDVIIRAVAVSVLDGELCFANATESVNCSWLRERCCIARKQRRAKLCQFGFAPGEVRITQMRNVPGA